MTTKGIGIKNRRNTLGISLLEVMLSIVVITGIVLASIRYYTTVHENARIAQAVEIINNVTTASFKWVEGSPDFSGITILELFNRGLLPQSYADSKNPVNPWRGTLEVSSPSGAPNSVTITLDGIPESSCNNLSKKINNVAGKNTAGCATGTGPVKFTATWSQ